MKIITVLIPCYNEERGISAVIRDIPRDVLFNMGYHVEVVVIDNNSTDRTVELARQLGANVIIEPKRGKGNAMKTGFLSINEDTDYVVMLDGDDTYKPTEIPRLIEPLESNFCDVIVGSRLGGKTLQGSLKFPNRIANWAYAFLVRHFYRANVTDVLSGFFSWRREALDHLKLHLNSDGFAIEMEMITKIVKLGYRIYSVPITYDVRKGESKIHAFDDGVRILKMFFQNLNWTPDQSKRKKLIIKVGLRIFTL
jgi:dolichol-phosphate hexosyltransferase